MEAQRSESTAVEWRPVTEYEGLYEISTDARVRRVGGYYHHPTVCRPVSVWVSSNGYPCVTLSANGKKRNRSLHRLLAMAFVPGQEEGKEVLHIDGNKLNCSVENLRWGSRSENLYDLVKHGGHAMANKSECKWGHEFTKANMYPNSPQRSCRTCKRARAAGLHPTKVKIGLDDELVRL